MNIIFKNVGQGDSIILEWESNGINKIGIIDCNKVKKQNPVLDYLIHKKINNIEFIIISHPHDDHYSGFKELLQHVEKEKITINWFGHTIHNVGKRYWKLFELGIESSKELDFILKQGIHLKKIGLLKRWESIVGNSSIEIDENIFLQSFSPAHDEIQEYQRIVELEAEINLKKASLAANLLSTVFKLTKEGRNILLTSDAVKDTFERIETEGKIKTTEFDILQIPHHGSIKNFHPLFWSNKNLKREEKHVVISAGQNLMYKHPHFETIKEINNNNFKLHCTNIVHGMETYVDLFHKSLSLDMISETIDDDLVGGDKIFKL